MGAIGTFINVGKVDGSEAMPGTVGEVLAWAGGVDTFMTRVNENAWDGVPFDRLQTFTIPPGDWDLHCRLDMEATIISTYVASYLGPSYVGNYPDPGPVSPVAYAQYMLRNVPAWDLSIEYATLRVNVTVPTNYVLELEIVASNQLPVQMIAYPAWWTIWIRRAR